MSNLRRPNKLPIPNLRKPKTLLEEAEEIKEYLIRNNGIHRVKYHESYHIELLIDTFARGGHLNDFCISAKVAGSTVNYWIQNHEKFREAYEMAHRCSVKYWIQYAINNPTIDSHKFRILGRYICGLDNIKLPNVKGKDFKSNLESVWKIIRGEDTTGLGICADALNRLIQLLTLQWNSENKSNGDQEVDVKDIPLDQVSQNRLAFVENLTKLVQQAGELAGTKPK